MPTVFGKDYSREDLEKRTGHLSQIAGIRASELTDGIERGVRTLDFRTGTGFAFSILPDRGLDLSYAEYRGAPLCWRSQVGDAHPAHYDPEGAGWLRTFQGGMLTTCGLMNIGVPSEEEGETFGVHGRISAAPARNVHWDAEWLGEEYVLWAQGRLREGRLFGENVTLTRRISTKLGDNRLQIRDVIRNEGFAPTPMQVLYHFNCGFPVLDETSEVLVSSEVEPRDDDAAAAADVQSRGGAPTPDFKEQVHLHHVKAGKDGVATAALVNRAFGGGKGIGVAIRFRPEELPYLWQWRQVGEGAYVMGLEPSNSGITGRAKERELGRLPILEARAESIHHLELEVLTGQKDIERIQEEVQAAS